jgi:hypothetical protein
MEGLDLGYRLGKGDETAGNFLRQQGTYGFAFGRAADGADYAHLIH